MIKLPSAWNKTNKFCLVKKIMFQKSEGFVSLSCVVFNIISQNYKIIFLVKIRYKGNRIVDIKVTLFFILIWPKFDKHDELTIKYFYYFFPVVLIFKYCISLEPTAYIFEPKSATWFKFWYNSLRLSQGIGVLTLFIYCFSLIINRLCTIMTYHNLCEEILVNLGFKVCPILLWNWRPVSWKQAASRFGRTADMFIFLLASLQMADLPKIKTNSENLFDMRLQNICLILWSLAFGIGCYVSLLSVGHQTYFCKKDFLAKNDMKKNLGITFLAPSCGLTSVVGSWW